jgi:L-ascorbate metabolism protein UlaG (beta-lactamase superfamily)
MHLTWLGSTAVKIQTKPFDKDVTVVIDPYKPAKGSFPRSLAPDIALLTRGEKNAITLSGNPFVLATPGECETKGVLMTATEGHEPNTTMVRVDAEQISVGHLGHTNKPLTDKQLDVLSGVDILFISVGGGETYSAEQAVKMVNTIEPRIVIPIAFKSPNDPKAADVSAFLKEIGAKDAAPEKKFIIKKKDLPQEETIIIVLTKE